jgi:hypothetical protein
MKPCSTWGGQVRRRRRRWPPWARAADLSRSMAERSTPGATRSDANRAHAAGRAAGLSDASSTGYCDRHAHGRHEHTASGPRRLKDPVGQKISRGPPQRARHPQVRVPAASSALFSKSRPNVAGNGRRACSRVQLPASCAAARKPSNPTRRSGRPTACGTRKGLPRIHPSITPLTTTPCAILVLLEGRVDLVIPPRRR